ncbi:Transposable element Tc1 transposase [Anthophora quadrimaculata]
MGRGKHVTVIQRLEILRLRNEKLTLDEISKRLKISINAVHQALKHIKVNKSVSDKIRSARPRKTTPRLDRTIHRLSEADRFRTAVDIHREISTGMGTQISVHTVRRRLIAFGLRGRVARKKPFISKKNHKARLTFAKEHLLWTRVQWAKVIFTDESKFNCFGSDGRCYVRRRVGEEFDTKCLKSTVKGRGGSVMVWAGMTINGPGPICRINGIMDQHLYVDILDKYLIPFTQENMPEHWIFQADNDPKHTSQKAKRFLEEHNVNVMRWPSQSPDLNPIEHLWNDVDKEIQLKKPSNLNNLYKIIENAWNNISIDRCIRLIDSMPRRCAEVIKKKGGPTKY